MIISALDRFFCCIPLRIGCIIIGILSVLLHVYDFIDEIQLLAYMGGEENEDSENKNQRSQILIEIILIKIYLLMQILVGFLLLYVVYKPKVAWLPYMSVFYLITISLYYFLIVVSQLSSMDIELLGAFTIVSLLYIYFAFIIWRYYKTVKEGTANTNEINQTVES